MIFILYHFADVLQPDESSFQTVLFTLSGYVSKISIRFYYLVYLLTMYTFLSFVPYNVSSLFVKDSLVFGLMTHLVKGIAPCS